MGKNFLDGNLGSWCPQCGEGVAVDEDGLCSSCGSTAIGDGADESILNKRDLKTATYALMESDGKLTAAISERDSLRAEVERLKLEAQDARRAAMEEAAGIAIAGVHRLSVAQYVTATEIAAAIRARIGQSTKTPDHAFVPGDSTCGWERQCSVIVPVIEGRHIVGAHCGYPPEAHALWASARDEDAAAIRAAAKEER